MARIEVAGGDGRWEAHDGARPVGALRAYTRPDRRTFVAFRDCRDDAYRPLLVRAAAELRRPALYTTVDERDDAGVRRLRGLGFVDNRRDHHYRVPVDPARLGLVDPVPPPGIALVSAADADQDRLRRLDDALRNDTPGAAGWRWDPQEFREETFLRRVRPRDLPGGGGGADGGARGSDATVDDVGRSPVRVHRNRASRAIAARAGAVRVGGSYELVRADGAGAAG